MIITPTVHLNGTSRAQLLEEYRRAKDAVNDAILAMQDAGPNGRDYYPQGQVAFNRAVAEHIERMKKLEAVSVELAMIIQTIDAH